MLERCVTYLNNKCYDANAKSIICPKTSFNERLVAKINILNRCKKWIFFVKSIIRFKIYIEKLNVDSSRGIRIIKFAVFIANNKIPNKAMAENIITTTMIDCLIIL